jgi:hypothetical protein
MFVGLPQPLTRVKVNPRHPPRPARLETVRNNSYHLSLFYGIKSFRLIYILYSIVSRSLYCVSLHPYLLHLPDRGECLLSGHGYYHYSEFDFNLGKNFSVCIFLGIAGVYLIFLTFSLFFFFFVFPAIFG